MNGKCFELGTIQAFLDGETTPEVSIRLTHHVAGCDACALLMSNADEENSIVFSALERELNSLVPTQRLWSRINETIEVEKSRAPFWQKTLDYLRSTLLNPSLATAAGVVMILGIFAIVSLKTGDDAVFVFRQVGPTAPAPGGSTLSSAPVTNSPEVTPSFTESKLAPRELQRLVQKASASGGQRAIRTQDAVYTAPAVDAYLPGEESYVRTISDLKQNVDGQKDAVMTPSTRVSYERDMAVVNDSIKRMREVVKKNPRNQAARQVLYSSYQDKIDLLSSVAQREELMASLK
jgi:anti-sigma factor RsiW